MKRLLFIAILLISFSIQNTNAQEEKKQAVLNENSVVKDLEGNIVAFKDVLTMIMSGDWTVRPKEDKDGNAYFQLKKNTEADKKRIKKLMQERIENSEYKGKDAPDFAFTDINGNRISSELTKGKVVVLNFWFITCKPCIAEIPELNDIHEKYKDNDDVVFAAITFETQEKVAKFLEKHPIAYPVTVDNKSTIKAFEVYSYPTNMVIGKNGKIANSVSGAFPNIGEFIEETIDKELNEE